MNVTAWEDPILNQVVRLRFNGPLSEDLPQTGPFMGTILTVSIRISGDGLMGNHVDQGTVMLRMSAEDPTGTLF
ncbi:MAG: hypothetical protein ACYCYP_00005 [Leptospirales bacterium]